MMSEAIAVSQREKALQAVSPGDLVYAYVLGHCDGLYQVGGIQRSGPVLLGVNVAAPPRSAIFSPF